MRSQGYVSKPSHAISNKTIPVRSVLLTICKYTLVDRSTHWSLKWVSIITLIPTRIYFDSDYLLHDGDLYAVGWVEGPWALVTRVKAIRVGVGFK